MSVTRTSISPGVFADDALTSIPGTPTLGVAYRDIATSQADSREGWPFGTKVDSATFNQILHEVTALLKILDTQGILGWTNLVDYAAGALVIGSDGNLYRAASASGPTTAPQDPITGGIAWVRFGAPAATSGEVTTGAEANKFVSPATLLGVFGAGVMAGAGYVQIPMIVGGVRRLFTAQWGHLAGLTSDNPVVVGLPVAFSTAHLACFASVDQVGAVGGSYSVYANNSSLSTITVTADVSAGSAGGIAAFWLALGW